MENTIKERMYPSIIDRLKAMIIDSVIIVILLVAFAYLFKHFENAPSYLRALAFAFVFVVYDPLLISLFSGTIGHMMIGLKVKSVRNTEKNIIFPMALIRFAVKVSLGWISLITVSMNSKSRAIHDLAVNSVVLIDQDEGE